MSKQEFKRVIMFVATFQRPILDIKFELLAQARFSLEIIIFLASNNLRYFKRLDSDNKILRVFFSRAFEASCLQLPFET